MKRLSILIVTLLTFIVSCSVNTNDLHIISEINISEQPEENERVGNDLISYDYTSMIKKDLNITDTNAIRNITWQYFVQDSDKKVTFRLILNGPAKEYKTVLIPFFENFVKNKQEEYKAKNENLKSAAIKANEIIELITDDQYDSIWQQSSPLMVEAISKEGFLGILEKRKREFKPEGEKVLQNRQLYSELSGKTGDFYVFSYAYSNKFYEQVIIEQFDKKFMLAGYKFWVPNK